MSSVSLENTIPLWRHVVVFVVGLFAVIGWLWWAYAAKQAGDEIWPALIGIAVMFAVVDMVLLVAIIHKITLGQYQSGNIQSKGE